MVHPPDQFDLSSVAEQGIDVVVPDRPDPGGSFQMADHPTWAALPAVRAGQVIAWHAAAPHSFGSYASVLAELAGHLERFTRR